MTEALREIVRVTLAAARSPAPSPPVGRAREMLAMGFKLASIGYDGALVTDAFTKALAEARG